MFFDVTHLLKQAAEEIVATPARGVVSTYGPALLQLTYGVAAFMEALGDEVSCIFLLYYF